MIQEDKHLQDALNGTAQMNEPQNTLTAFCQLSAALQVLNSWRAGDRRGRSVCVVLTCPISPMLRKCSDLKQADSLLWW